MDHAMPGYVRRMQWKVFKCARKCEKNPIYNLEAI